MPGTCIAGRLAKLELSDDGGTTYENYGGIVDITLNTNIDELECTSHDSNGVREYIPNHSDFTLDVSGRWIDTDAGQAIVLAAVAAKSTFLFKFTMETAAGAAIWSGSAFATSASPSGPLDDTGSFDVTLRCSSVVQGTQP
jgi:predicted secreted protein